MQRGYSKFIKLIHFLGDLSLLNISFILAYFIRFGSINLFHFGNYSTLLFFFNLTWLLIIQLIDIYAIYRVTHIEKIFSNLIKAVLLHILGLTFVSFFLHDDYSRSHLLLTYTIFIFLVVNWRFLIIWQLKQYRKKGYNYRKIIIIGTGPIAQEIYKHMNSDLALGYKIQGFFDAEVPENELKNKYLGDFSQIKEYCTKNIVDEVYIALSTEKGELIRDLIHFAENNLIRLKIVPDFRRYIQKKVKIDFYGSIPIILLRKEPLESFMNRLIKRTFDVIISSLIIMVVFPWLFPIIALIIKLTSRGPLFFVQERTGKNDHNFNCFKFRTMKINNKANTLQAIKDDPRLTRIGKILRKFNIDELPQFFNVLKGDMSIVGPRPHMLKHTEDYSRLIDKYMVRHFIKPGITGWAQVLGFRGETKNIEQMEDRVKADIWYIENWTLALDLKIIIKTILNIFKGEQNAY
ncbi:MAG: undecaprenyl-phosphate glucose phosphotransferase [Bacteroidota bacterium]|nr:undecaprenyl-phosphate glucose phosphotransferase [Bacteroidota bacterium]